MIAAALLGAAPSLAPPCSDIAGWGRIMASPSVRWIVIGETHGTQEAPAIFADAVGLAAQS
ncbi:MAG TPA: hypothetical protein VNS79_13845 [Sphingobium sp.]|nr:hypothetical protein [Sphingobium sp.]